jgi:hypothetical protein
MSIEKEIWMKERFKDNKNEKKKKEKRVRFWQTQPCHSAAKRLSSGVQLNRGQAISPVINHLSHSQHCLLWNLLSCQYLLLIY